MEQNKIYEIIVLIEKIEMMLRHLKKIPGSMNHFMKMLGCENYKEYMKIMLSLITDLVAKLCNSINDEIEKETSNAN